MRVVPIFLLLIFLEISGQLHKYHEIAIENNTKEDIVTTLFYDYGTDTSTDDATMSIAAGTIKNFPLPFQNGKKPNLTKIGISLGDTVLQKNTDLIFRHYHIIATKQALIIKPKFCFIDQEIVGFPEDSLPLSSFEKIN